MTQQDPRNKNGFEFKDRHVFAVLIIIFVLAIACSIVSYWGGWENRPKTLAEAFSSHEWLNSFFQNTGTEFLGALITFLLIETLLRRRRERESQEQQEKLIQKLLDRQRLQELIRMMGGQDNNVTKLAVDELLERGWLTDGSLRKANLIGAHLEGANLIGAHLERANLIGAHLEGARLWDAHLERAELIGAHLEGANLREAHLEKAHLWESYLEGADLTGAHLEEAYLFDAHLEGADLTGAHLEGADLWKAHLEGADLLEAHLEEADLRGARLERADLRGADLKGATLLFAHLEGADLKGTHLERADLRGAHLEVSRRLTIDELHNVKTLEGATLPDGTSLPGQTSDRYDPRVPEPDWRGAFEEWAKTAPVDEYGYIIPVNSDLSERNLSGIKYLTIEFLKNQQSLKGTTLPDGTILPDHEWTELDSGVPEPDWRISFNEWAKTVPVDENGYIIPADEKKD